jgi:hypothetical protein
MVNNMIPMPCAEPRMRPIQGLPLAAAFVVHTAAVDVPVQGTGLSTGAVKYGGQGSRAWSPPD